MINLLHKEFRLVIHPLYHLVPLFAALILIPYWVYFVALMYFLFIAIPNIFTNAKAQNDTGFSVLLPVKKSDVVKARVLSMAVLEIIQVAVAAIFVAINLLFVSNNNFLIDANLAYLGCALMMYGIFNLLFFPLFYKTADKIGVPILISLTVAFLFTAVLEVASLLVAPVNRVLDGINAAALVRQIPVLLAGGILFVLLTWLAYRRSAARFEKVDL